MVFFQKMIMITCVISKTFDKKNSPNNYLKTSNNQPKLILTIHNAFTSLVGATKCISYLHSNHLHSLSPTTYPWDFPLSSQDYRVRNTWHYTTKQDGWCVDRKHFFGCITVPLLTTVIRYASTLYIYLHTYLSTYLIASKSFTCIPTYLHSYEPFIFGLPTELWYSSFYIGSHLSSVR